MAEGSPKKPHRAAAPPTRAVRSRRSVRTSSIPCSACLAWGPDLDPNWLSPRGQRPRRNGFCGSRVGLLGTEFQFTAEGLHGRGRRCPGELGLRAGHHEGQAGGGRGGLDRAPGGKCSIKETKAIAHRGGGSRRICFPRAPPAWITLKGAALSTRIPLRARAATPPADGGGDLKKKKKKELEKRKKPKPEAKA